MLKFLITIFTALSFSLAHAQSLEKCKPIPVNAFSGNINLSTGKDCRNAPSSPGMAENLYFGAALNYRADDLMCVQKSIAALKLGEAPGMSQLSDKIIAGTEKKAKLIAELKAVLVKLTAERGRLTPSLQLEQVKQNDANQNMIRQMIELTYQSMYLGSTTQMRDYADSIAKKEMTPEKKKELFNHALAKTLDDVRTQSLEVNQLKSQNTSTEMTDELKRSLTKDSGLLEKMTAGQKPETAEYLKNVQCNLDEKFGYRREARNHKIDVALNVVAILIPIGTGFTLLKFAGSRVLASARIVQGAKEVSFAAGLIAGGVAGFDSVARACLNSSRDIKVGSKATCTGNNEELNNYFINNLEKQDCVHEALLQGLYVVPGAALEVRELVKKYNQAQATSKSFATASNVNLYTPREHTFLSAWSTNKQPVLDKLVEAKDPHALYLKSVGTSNPSTVFKNIDDRITERVKSGAYTENEVIRPARFYELKNGKIEAYTLNDVVPEGAKPFNSLLPNPVYWKALADGKTPIGDAGELTSFNKIILGPALSHDGVHFSGLERAKDLEKSLREIAGDVSKMSEVEQKLIAPRLDFVNEQMTAFPRYSESKIQDVLSAIKPAGKTEAMSQAEYFAVLQNKTDSELKQLWKSSEKIPKIETYGGLSADSIAKQQTGATAILSPIEYAYNGGSNGAKLAESTFTRDNLIEALSSRLTVADHLKGQSPGKIAKDIYEYKKNSPVIKLFCNNAQLWANAHYASQICNNK